ncbi:MAG: glycosyltransferase family protein [Ignavibacteria bacterium]|jgi:spore coat polysaccharide biosynthesis protein SpsF|nr:glycosyltransferase family protein [Ignavibacteria bacterium]
MKIKKIVIIVQARSNSSRLPGKVLLPLCGEEMLIRQIQRISRSRYGSEIVVATTTSDSDRRIVRACEKENIPVFRGSENDLLDRHYKTAIYYEADIVCKIPSDCPLIDPQIIDMVFDYYYLNAGKFDFVSNLHPPSYPDGNDVEIMPFNVLKRAWIEAKDGFQREHTTPYIWDNPDKFNIGNYRWQKGYNYSMTHRFTVDYREDYEFVKAVYEELFPKNPYFTIYDILKLLKEKPEIAGINRKFNGINWYRDHLEKLNTIKPERTKII